MIGERIRLQRYPELVEAAAKSANEKKKKIWPQRAQRGIAATKVEKTWEPRITRTNQKKNIGTTDFTDYTDSSPLWKRGLGGFRRGGPVGPPALSFP
jgi:hypothetical protein